MLVGLMVVITIVAILVAIAIPRHKEFQLKAKTAEAKKKLPKSYRTKGR